MPARQVAMLLPLVLLLGSAGAAAVRSEGPATLESLRFMAGCWRGLGEDGQTIEEYYTPPTENLMLGVTRYVREGRVTGFEFSTIARQDTVIVLTPRPEGQRAVPFQLTRLEARGAVWENPAHDFPTLIAYRRLPGDTLVARIEGPGAAGSRRSAEWRMTRARCGG